MLYIKISNIRVMKIIEYIIGTGKIGLDSTVPFEMIWLCFYFFFFSFMIILFLIEKQIERI